MRGSNVTSNTITLMGLISSLAIHNIKLSLVGVMRYGIESARVISRRHHSWEDIDEKLTVHIPTTEKEKEIKDKDRRKPVSIVFPYSYAILETLVSYLVAAFFPEPIFRYEGVVVG